MYQIDRRSRPSRSITSVLVLIGVAAGCSGGASEAPEFLQVSGALTEDGLVQAYTLRHPLKFPRRFPGHLDGFGCVRQGRAQADRLLEEASLAGIHDPGEKANGYAFSMYWREASYPG